MTKTKPKKSKTGLQRPSNNIASGRQLLEASLRHDFPSFIERCFQAVNPGVAFLSNWHYDAMADRLEKARAGKLKRLMITMPPRYGKSLCVSVAWTAYILGHNPSARIIHITYSSDLSAEFARQTREIMSTAWYKQLFPKTLLAKDTELELVTTKQGFRYATSVGGTLTGRGGDYIIIDDPIKPDDAMSEVERRKVINWYKGTLSTRLDNKNEGVIVLVMQRLHPDDLAGYLMENEGDHWEHLNLPAIAEDHEMIATWGGLSHQRRSGDALHEARESAEQLHRQKKLMGSLLFSAQYQQRPVPAEGNLIKRAWFQNYSIAPEKRERDQIVQSWDTAAKAGELNDYSVCLTFLVRGAKYYLLHVDRVRLDFPGLKRRVLENARRFEADIVLIEDTAAGTALIQQLRQEGCLMPIPIKPKGDKIVRMSAQSAKIEAGSLFLPESANWLDTFLEEVLAFPNARHDDQVDALSQFLGWKSMRDRRTEIICAPILITADPYLSV